MREWLKKCRQDRGLTQGVIANLIGVNITTYGKYELGTRRPSVEKAKEIGKHLNLDWTMFFNESA